MTVIKEPKGDFFDDAYTLTSAPNPVSDRGAPYNEKPMHIGDISCVLGVERHLISMHLDILELYGFVESKRVISEEGQTKGRVRRIVQLTDKVAKVCSELQKELQPFI